jgi:hypothetical protein
LICQISPAVCEIRTHERRREISKVKRKETTYSRRGLPAHAHKKQTHNKLAVAFTWRLCCVLAGAGHCHRHTPELAPELHTDTPHAASSKSYSLPEHPPQTTSPCSFIQSPAMFDFCFTLPYGTFLVLGGLIGAIKAGSTASAVFGRLFLARLPCHVALVCGVR